MSRQIRWVATVLVVCLLAGGAAQAWVPVSRPAPAAEEEAGVLAALWEWLVSLIGGPEPQEAGDSSRIHEKSGCGMDPDGLPRCK
jgi:hypothetical protein